MWSRVLCSSLLVVLVFLAACQSSPTGNVVITQELGGPKDIVINSSPVPVPSYLPPVVAAAPEQVVIPASAQEVIVIPEQKPADPPVQDCLGACDASCKDAAARSCKQTTGAACKQNCGAVIETSACSTACSLRSAHACEPKFIEFCSAKCTGVCY